MAYIPIYRQQYDVEDQNQVNGYAPNTISEALTGEALTSGTEYQIPADFKDHKTVFTIISQSGSTVTFKAGNTYQGVKDLVVEVPSGTSMIWLDSAKFADKISGEITVKADAAVTMYGYEMR